MTKHPTVTSSPHKQPTTTAAYYSILARVVPQGSSNKKIKLSLLLSHQDEEAQHLTSLPRLLSHKAPEKRHRIVRARTAYKPKHKKVRPQDVNDGTGEGPGGKPDWYKRSQTRFKEQPPEGKYARHLLPRIAPFPKGSRLTTERLQSINVGAWLWPEERRLFDEMMLNREGVMAFDWKEIGKIHPDVTPPIVIKTIPHQAWQEKNFPCPRAMLPSVTKMMRDRLERGVLEKCNGPYRNPWFLVAKKEPGTYRLINAAMKMNSVTMRDANMPPSVDEFSEEFAGCQCASLVDFFSGYDQLDLDPASRDLTGFMTPLGLLRMTTPPQGATNSVAQFVRVVMTILEDLYPDVAIPFLDDIGIKGPYTNYDDEETLPGIRRFVYEHIQNLDKTLDRLERAGACLGPKSQFCANGMNIVGFICGSAGRSPAASKIEKIISWAHCENVTEVKAFMGICVYYRIWIKSFATIAEPLYRLCRKQEPFIWGEEQVQAMETLKSKLTTAPLLCKIHYQKEDGWGDIVLGVDSSLNGWGGTLGQYDDKKRRRVARYESGLWNHAEQSYDATKRECRGILKCLQKLRFWLYGVHFVLETDAKVLVAQLGRAATDLPGALITRWLAWIRLFDFEIKHVRGKKHTAADGLSRRPWTSADRERAEQETDIDDFIAHELDANLIESSNPHESPTTAAGQPSLEGAPLGPLNDSYSERYQIIARHLLTLERPKHRTLTEHRKIVREATKYSVRSRQLWRNGTKSYPPRLVLDSKKDKLLILKELHDRVGHAGRESTYHRIAARYFWEGCWTDCRNFVASCRICQHRDKLRIEEALTPSRVVPLFQCIGIDVTKMPLRDNYNCIVIARCDFTGWPEAKPMFNPTAAKIADFIHNDVICRHGVFGEIKMDGGPEFKGAVIKSLSRRDIKVRTISAYNSKANGMIERGHKPLTAALIALTAGGAQSWTKMLPWVLFAIRTTTHAPTGHTPFFLTYGREAVLPVETRFPTWRTLPWDTVTSSESLIAMRARQVEMRDKDIEEAVLRKERHRKENAAYFDENHRLRTEPIHKDDIVLAYDVKQIDQDMSSKTKLLFRWLGPYRVTIANQEKSTYKLEELDGTPIRRTYAGNRIKRFVKREGYWFSVEDHEDDEESLPVPPNARFIFNDETAEEEERAAQEFRQDEGVIAIAQDTGAISRRTRSQLAKSSIHMPLSDIPQPLTKSVRFAVEIPPIATSEKDNYQPVKGSL